MEPGIDKLSSEPMGAGFIPRKMPESTLGYCPWTKLQFRILPEQESQDAVVLSGLKGSLEVTFRYNCTKPNDAVAFTNQLNFRRRRGKRHGRYVLGFGRHSLSDEWLLICFLGCYRQIQTYESSMVRELT
jgi:hypothetical protein